MGGELVAIGETVVVRIIKRYLAQYRELFADDELSRALMDVLDVFAAVGWPAARRLVYGLEEI